MSKTGFDFEDFIESVKPFTFLYDRNCPEFKDTALKSRKWQVIGDQYGIAAHDAQKKWANLKDKYMRLKKELVSKSRNGENNIQLPKWAFYNLMDNVYSAINGGGHRHSPLQFVFESNSSALSWQDNISIHEEADGNSRESPLPQPNHSISSNGQVPDANRRHKRRQTEEEIVHCIQNSTQALQELSSIKRQTEDGPHYFCMWIAERMRDLSQMKQYKLQHAIHNALAHIEMEDDDES